MSSRRNGGKSISVEGPVRRTIDAPPHNDVLRGGLWDTCTTPASDRGTHEAQQSTEPHGCGLDPAGQLKPGLHQLDPNRIVVPPDRRKLRTSVNVAESIDALGLLQPLVVTPDYRLVAGLRRLEAVKSLGWETVPCIVTKLDTLKAELAEIDENVVRNEPRLWSGRIC
jgi:hypothetical protein